MNDLTDTFWPSQRTREQKTDQDIIKRSGQQGNASVDTNQREVNKRGQCQQSGVNKRGPCQQSDTYTEVSDIGLRNLTHRQNYSPSRYRPINRNKSDYNLRNWVAK